MFAVPPTAPRTLADQLFQNAVEIGDRPALVASEGGEFLWRTWGEIAADVIAMASSLRRRNVRSGERVVQVSENCYSWIVVDLALQTLGAIHVPLHVTSPNVLLAKQILHCGARLVVAASNSAAQSFAALPEFASGRVAFVAHAELAASADTDVAPRTEIAAADSLATIIYTSGSAGEPKGVMLSHANLLANANGILDAFGATPSELRLNFLPFSHVFARTCDLYVWLVERSRLALATSRDTVLADCAALCPTLINGVPYFFEKVRRGLRAAGFAEVPGALKKAFGGALRMANSGGAALSDELFDYYQRQGVSLQQGYGLTEAAPVVTTCTLTHRPRGTVGRPLPDVELRLAADGEVLVRGPNVMLGYYRDEAATAATLRDGWLSTGDCGSLGADGSLRITGRKKELLVLTNGRNVSPAYVEMLLTSDPLIAQAVVVGDGRDFPVALLVLDPQEVAARGWSFDPASLIPQVSGVIAERLKDLAPYEQVRRFALLSRPLSLDAGELTPKLSPRRDVITRNFASEIEKLYS